MSKIRVVSSVGDGYRWTAEEDGKSYHGVRHNLKPMAKRAKLLDAKMNKDGNSKDWGYLGSAHMSQVSHWLKGARYSMNDFATNRHGAQDKFWKWHEQSCPDMYPGYKKRQF